LGLGFGNISGDNVLYQGMSSMHNEYLRFFVEGGIIGGILFTFIVGLLILSIIRIYLINPMHADIGLPISLVLMFLASELQYNFLNAPREGIILAFFSCASVCWKIRRN
jgi:O-antigen ligase